MPALEVWGAMRAGASGAGDAVLIDAGLGLAVVADAIGDDRALAGLACREVRAGVAAPGRDPVADGLAAAERAVAARHGRVALALIARQGGELALAHAGAVRIYVLRAAGGPRLDPAAPRWSPAIRLASGATFAALTRDHGSIAAMVEHGLISRAAGRAHPLRARLTRAVGAGMRPERQRFAPCAGDRVLVVTNGVWEQLDDDELAARLAAAATPRAACDAVLAALGGDDHAGVAALFVEPPAGAAAVDDAAPRGAGGATPMLDRFGRDLTAAARAGRLDPVSGRDAELTRLQLALLSRRKPNAILVGEPGVGKTSLVEALAQAAVAGTLPRELAGLRIVEVAAGALIGGAKLRGELEDRVTQLIAEAEAEAPRLVVFLDEIHALLGAATAGVQVADLLKPALARGRLRVIGATTPGELERLTQDEALIRRFEILRIDEPTAAATRTMLATARGELEHHFGVAFLDEALDAAIELTVRHVPARRLPDKAIDALEHAGARGLLDGVRAPIGRAELAAALAERLGLPRDALEPDDARRITAAGERLAAELVGQAPAIARITAALRGRRARGPRASLLLVGPTGVGKTEAARVLADALYGPGRLVRFDMSEYAQDHQVARLLGAPPGYVGHQRPGALIEALRTRPGGVVLFDELEKAHPDAWALLLQILDEGQLTDGGGRIAHLGDAVVILTSNLLSGRTAPARALGFVAAAEQADDDEPALRQAVRQHLPAELVGRIGAVVAFRAPDLAARGELVARRLARFAAGRGSLAARVVADIERAAAPRVADLAISPRELAVFVDDLAASRAGALGSVDTLRPNARLVLAVAALPGVAPVEVERLARGAGVALRYVTAAGAATIAGTTTVADALAVARAAGAAVIDHGRVRHDGDGLHGVAVERARGLAARLAPAVYLTDDAVAQLPTGTAPLTRWPDPQTSLWRCA